MIALYLAVKHTAARMEALAGRLEEQSTPILSTTRSIIDDLQPKISVISENLAESTTHIRAQVANAADATGEIVERVRNQAARVDAFVSGTMTTIETTTEVVQEHVLTPVRRVRAIVQAVNAGLSFLKANRARKHASGTAVEEDEEMFI